MSQGECENSWIKQGFWLEGRPWKPWSLEDLMELCTSRGSSGCCTQNREARPEEGDQGGDRRWPGQQVPGGRRQRQKGEFFGRQIARVCGWTGRGATGEAAGTSRGSPEHLQGRSCGSRGREVAGGPQTCSGDVQPSPGQAKFEKPRGHPGEDGQGATGDRSLCGHQARSPGLSMDSEG